MLRDPVCEKRINRYHAQAAIQYKGIVYYVCGPLCQFEFKRDPARYARPNMGERPRVPKNRRTR